MTSSSPAHRHPSTPVHYTVLDAGTFEEPAFVIFNIDGGCGPGLALLRGLLPDTVTLELRGLGFALQGVHPLDRLEIWNIFNDLVQAYNRLATQFAWRRWSPDERK